MAPEPEQVSHDTVVGTVIWEAGSSGDSVQVMVPSTACPLEKVIAQLQARYAAETNCRTLRIKPNAMLGYFVEVEGEPGDIRTACADLGLDPGAHIGDNYLSLWIKYLKERGEPWRDMVFSHAADDAADLARLTDLLF